MRQPTAKILPGECYVSKTGEMIVTVLGSCIAACIRDTRLGVGGMNHFMLPVQQNHSGRSAITAELAYGNWAMEFLVNEILKLGGKKSSLEIKIFGGGKVLSSISNIDIGARNIDFVKQFIANEGMSILAEDVGSNCPRKVLYFPDTGSVKLKRLRTTANNTIQKRELEYFETMKKKPDQGEVELF
ncbi:MAG: chemoreceptor glutamine deamidase CheD [Agarilytica sp.]